MFVMIFNWKNAVLVPAFYLQKIFKKKKIK